MVNYKIKQNTVVLILFEHGNQCVILTCLTVFGSSYNHALSFKTIDILTDQNRFAYYNNELLNLKIKVFQKAITILWLDILLNKAILKIYVKFEVNVKLILTN